MKCALIGLGMVSKTYGDALRNSDSVSLALVHARSPESRTAFLNDWPDLGAQAAESVEEIAASDVDFVILTTPPNARAGIVETLSAAGKPILMEKPVERTVPKPPPVWGSAEEPAFPRATFIHPAVTRATAAGC